MEQNLSGHLDFPPPTRPRRVQEGRKALYAAAFNHLTPRLGDLLATVSGNRVRHWAVFLAGERGGGRAPSAACQRTPCCLLGDGWPAERHPLPAPCAACWVLQATVYQCHPQGDLEVVQVYTDTDVGAGRSGALLGCFAGMWVLVAEAEALFLGDLRWGGCSAASVLGGGDARGDGAGRPASTQPRPPARGWMPWARACFPPWLPASYSCAPSSLCRSLGGAMLPLACDIAYVVGHPMW